MALLCGRAGRLTTKNGGFRPGQWCEETHTTKDGHTTHGWDRHDATTWDDQSFGEGHALGGAGDGSGGVSRGR
jgi:hypothetical protein